MKNYIHHIVLTVKNAAQSAEFYKKVLGWDIVEQKSDHACLVPDGKKYPSTDFMLVLGELRDHEVQNNVFDRNRIGLDHFAFNIETQDELNEIEARFRSQNIVMEEGGITEDDFGGTAIFLKDPDGMKVEFHLMQSK